MNLPEAKRRLAVALVESIFRRAGYTIEPLPGSRVPPADLSREDLPDFLVRRDGAGPARPVKVRTHPPVAAYLALERQRRAQSVLVHARRHWPGLLWVFLAEDPEPGHSAFQVLDVDRWDARAGPHDLWAHPDLDLYRQNVEEHEVLARRLLALFNGSDARPA